MEQSASDDASDSCRVPVEERLTALARELGFSLVGIAPATEADGFIHFQEWLENGYAGEMGYLHRQREARRHPSSILHDVRSVVMLGMEYAGSGNWKSAAVGRVAAYAAGPDYHRLVWDRINLIAAWVEREVPGCHAKGVADTAPLLERDFARRAGLGWVGKNTLLINPSRGSFFFLAAVLTDLELKVAEPFAGSHCGTCTACLEACPTKAFPQPHVLDATKCISYLTIELRTPIPVELREPMGDWLFGCDVCQEVCPWNRHLEMGPNTFPHDATMEFLDPAELLGLNEDEFRDRFKKTALWRNRRAGLLRNAAIVLGNVGDDRALAALVKATCDKEEVVREAAAWAIARIHQRTSRVNSGLPSGSSV
ncbi:MAG TPA: tRNA epoxyqueuosine(34) reductase QueG [Gemmata sp.]|nr:tRNA epoxyqueuosine(34) reductase QueG [Gemmata sp.]